MTEGRLGGMHCLVKPTFLILIFATLGFACGVASAQKPLAPLPPLGNEEATVEKKILGAPPEVEAAAVAAVAKLGEEVVLGRYHVAVERMNPLWKKRAAERMGGMQELDKQLAGVAKQMVQQGISMISFRPKGRPQSFEVSPGKKVEKVGGHDVESLIFTKWMVFVPTVTQFRINRQGEVKPLVIDSTGFQVAIADKGTNDWTFIDGAGVSVSDLRILFGTLPMNLILPPLEKHESR